MWFGAISLLLVVTPPLLNATAADFALHLPDFYLNLFGKYLSLAILALGLGLLWGVAGIMSLGQAVFFGLGGYCIGMTLMLEIGAAQSKYGEAIPDFMVWNQVKQLPWFWRPFSSFVFAVAAVILVPALFALIFGYLTFRSRIRGVYVSILTQVLAFVAWLLFNRNEMALGGTNGLTDFKTVLGFSLGSQSTQRWLYVVTASCLVLAYGVCGFVKQSKLGKVLLAVRDNENRLRFCGFSASGYKIFAFMLAAVLAAVAGALYVPQVGIITPSQIGVLPSLEVVVWVALGGRDHLLGGPLGAVVVNGLRTVLTSYAPQAWPFLLGGLFLGVVLVFPHGLAGLPAQLRGRLRRYRSAVAAEAHTGHEAPAVVRAADNGAAAASAGRAPVPVPTAIAPGAASPPQPHDTIIYLEGVEVSFEGFRALRNLSFFMEKGELRFVIGPNGAGKTTLLDVICGKVRPIDGRVIFDATTDLLMLRENQIVQAGIGRKFQAPNVFPQHTVYDNILLSLAGRRDVVGTLLARASRADRDRIFGVLERVNLGPAAARRAGTLAHGQKQWLEIGMLLALNPRLLLLDEPVAGMTGREREDTGLLIEALARDHSVLVIEHDMEFVRRFARTVTVMHEGTVLCEGPMERVQNDPRVIEVYLGREQEAHA